MIIMLDAVYEEKDLGVFITHNLKPALQDSARKRTRISN